MPKCSNCRKADAVETRWEKIRFWIAIHLFPLDFKDERANAFTQGFGDGYKMSAEHTKANAKRINDELFSIELPSNHT